MNDKLIKIFHDFISEEESRVLSKWTLDNYQESFFIDPKMNNDSRQTRFSTRHAYLRDNQYKNHKVKYPKESFDIQKRIFEKFNLSYKNTIPFPSFTDGIITTICFSPGSCSSHKDPIYFPNTYTIHCNFCTQIPESGGITIIEGKKYHFNNRDMIVYATSHLEHEVTESYGDTPRVLWVFGFSLNYQQISNIFDLKKFQYI